MNVEVMTSDFLLLRSNEGPRLERSSGRKGIKRSGQADGIVSLLTVVLLMGALGVPMYAAMELGAYNAIPLDLGNLNIHVGSAQAASTGAMGDIVAYMLWHWGAYPTYSFLVSAIAGAFAGAGVPIAGSLISAATDAFLASGAVSVGSITDILLVTVAVVDPVTLTIIGAVAAVIVGY
ncbi:MAG: hypothetical protein AMDU2_EPLC00011G0029 [Thermoplasmatales archaeon E-plasma]|nr:MAG: hypothetical protein AMDU2_EPLC00011G0029 [Thermoplasmatales archaeon E-plasma]